MKINEFVEDLLREAYQMRASDIFVIPYKEDFQISFKIRSGKLDYQLVKEEVGEQLINFLKFQSGMDISEHRRPQIGSTKHIVDSETLNLRLSSVGNYLGREILVVRIIYAELEGVKLPENFKQLTNKKGLILFSGPMGSGKTSFMYSYAKYLAHDKLVMCIEDPTEIKADEFIQLQVNEDAGMSYEELVKASLRQRPDVLVIGEIRDAITANLVVKAALSGYTVLSTIHAKSKYSVIDRMREFGVDEYSLKSAILAAVYQRLIPSLTDELICLQDSLMGSQLKLAFNRESTSELSDWKSKINSLYEEGVINQKILAEFIHG